MLFQKSVHATHRPSLSRSTFEMRRGYYIVFDGEMYHYYQIKVSKNRNASLYWFSKAPPLVRDGFATIPDENNVTRMYAVTTDDLLRGVIRTSREITKQQLRAIHGFSNAADQHDVGTHIEQAVLGSGERGVESTSPVEDDAVIDQAWLGEIEALFEALVAKEE